MSNLNIPGSEDIIFNMSLFFININKRGRFNLKLINVRRSEI